MQIIKKFGKKAVCLIVMLTTVFSVSGEASVLGSKELYNYSYEVGDGLYLIKNRFLSDQSGVGNQTENYFEYLPNSRTRPIVTVGKYVYGGEDINEIYEYLSESGVRTLGGINGDFFSFQTGVPNGHVVIDKKIISTDERPLPALGIRADGSAFIDDFQIITKMYHNGEEAVIPFINKYLQKWGYYMYDSNYYSKITPSSSGKYVTLKILEGDMTLGGVLKTEVVSVEDNITEKALSDGYIVIGLTYEADPMLFNVFLSFSAGDTVEFTFNSNNNALWEQAIHILASDAGQIVKNGAYCGADLAGASPRTAVGVAADGRIFFYTIDGRQSGHSYGVRVPTLASRMIELGCVDVINLDGGGSTVISASLGGTGTFELQNSPSDGTLRNDSTYIFFENTSAYTGSLEKLFLYPSTIYAKSGTAVNYIVKGADSGYFPVNVSAEPVFTASGGSYVENNVIYASGNDISEITATVGSVSATAKLRSVETPDSIKIYANGGEISSISLEAGESVDLNVVAYYNGEELVSKDSAFEWSVTGGAGSITKDGVFTMGENSGSVVVKAGAISKEIPVSGGAFSDISGNWASHYINDLYKRGVVNGFATAGGKFEFRPSDYVTKAEMAVMLSRAMNIDLSAYSDVVLPFSDLAEIPSWAISHIKALYGRGVINGTQSGNKIYFYPNATVSRAEIFTIAGRILNASSATPCPFSDRSEIPSWAVSYIDALYEKGMINGYSDNMLKPYSSITRAEISKIIVKALFN